MSERPACPRACALVAGITWRACGNMIRRLAERGNTVVATGTWCRDAGVIHYDGRAAEAHRALVAVAASPGGGHMIGGFPERHRAIVAGGAGRVRLGVIDETQVAPC